MLPDEVCFCSGLPRGLPGGERIVEDEGERDVEVEVEDEEEVELDRGVVLSPLDPLLDLTICCVGDTRSP